MNEPATTATGIFVDFEGVDGSGKTTLIKNLMERPEIRALNPYARNVSRHPDVNAAIFNILKSASIERGQDIEALLALTAHVNFQAMIVGPVIGLGHLLLADRGIASCMAYQSGIWQDEEDTAMARACASLKEHLLKCNAAHRRIITLGVSYPESKRRISLSRPGFSEDRWDGMSEDKFTELQNGTVLAAACLVPHSRNRLYIDTDALSEDDLCIIACDHICRWAAEAGK